MVFLQPQTVPRQRIPRIGVVNLMRERVTDTFIEYDGFIVGSASSLSFHYET